VDEAPPPPAPPPPPPPAEPEEPADEPDAQPSDSGEVEEEAPDETDEPAQDGDQAIAGDGDDNVDDTSQDLPETSSEEPSDVEPPQDQGEAEEDGSESDATDDDSAVPEPSIDHWGSNDEPESDPSINPVTGEPFTDDAEGEPLPPPDFSEPAADDLGDDLESDNAAAPVPNINDADDASDAEAAEIPAPEPSTFIQSEYDRGPALDDNNADADEVSQFEYEPPFRPRRNPLKMWTAAAAAFAIVTFGLIAAVSYYGAPSWLPIKQPTWAVAQPELELDFPADQLDRRTLPNGTEYFGVSGTVTNTGQETATVPSILIVLSDERDKPVFDWEIVPPKSELAPGETITISEAMTDIPRSAKRVAIGWKPS